MPNSPIGLDIDRCVSRDQFKSEHSVSEPIENHAISNELSNVNLVKKDLHQRNRVLVFRRDREPSKISTNSGTFEEQEQKG